MKNYLVIVINILKVIKYFYYTINYLLKKLRLYYIITSYKVVQS